MRGDSVLGIPGTSDSIRNQDVARLNQVPAEYAGRYNRLISVENFRTPNFPLVADVLYWLVQR